MKATYSLLTSGIFLIGSMVAPGRAYAQGQSQDHRPDGKGDRSRNVLPPAATGGAGTTGNGIDYHGGPVMLGATNIYYIWYGTWNAGAVSILTNLAQNIGGSPYFNINTTYFNGAGTNVSNSVNFGGSTTDNYSRSTSLGDADIATIVSTALTSKQLPIDPNGVYFVLTSADVNETSGFCTQYCGWHTYGFLNGANIKYSFVGNSDRCPSACTAQRLGPNGTTGVDGMASVIAHELEESVSDPNLNAWYDSTGAENADKCAWTFGRTYAASNGAAANMKLGPMDYLIQQNWLNASGGFCALSYGSTSPDFSLTVSPNSQSALPGSSTSNYVVTINPSNGFSAGVSLTTSTLPAGATPSFSVNPATGASNLSISLASSVAGGTYPFTITGTNSSLTHTVNATLVVTSPNFSLSVSPNSLSVAQGGTTGNYGVTITRSNGFSSSVNLSASGLPAGATPTFSSNPAMSSSNLTVSVSSTTATGTYAFTITGVGNSLTHSVSATLVVTGPSFSLSVSPGSQTVAPGGTTGSYVTTINWSSGSGSVNLSLSGLPSGATANGLPPSATSSASFTVTAGTVQAGSYPFTIIGSMGSVSHTAAATLVVSPAGSFTITMAPASLTVIRGSQGSYTVSVVPTGGFNSNVQLSVSGLPGHSSSSFSRNPVTGGSGTAMLQVSINPKPPQTGTYTITVTGTSGTLTSQGTATLVVN